MTRPLLAGKFSRVARRNFGALGRVSRGRFTRVLLGPIVTLRIVEFVVGDLYGGGMLRTPRPGWHGIPPSQDKFNPPVTLPEPAEGVHWTTEKAPSVWVELIYPGGVVQTVKGFAMAWTREVVQVQWVEYSMAREAWVTADKVRRRQIEEKNRHRDG